MDEEAPIPSGQNKEIMLSPQAISDFVRLKLDTPVIKTSEKHCQQLYFLLLIVI